MKTKGYAYSLFVLLIFLSAFIIVVTNVKSISVMQESSYDKLSIQKSSEFCKNLRWMMDNGISCDKVRSMVASMNLPFTVSFPGNCAKDRFTVTSLAGRYSCGGCGNIGAIIPLYIYPTDDDSWNRVRAAHNAYPKMPIIVIANDRDGEFASEDPFYESAIDDLRGAGITVLGYVATGYATKPLAECKHNIGNWSSLYDVDGIFFDEVNSTDNIDIFNYYLSLSSYAKSLGMTLTVGDPGTEVPRGLLSAMDNVMIYEDFAMPSLIDLQSRTQDYGRGKYSSIAHNVSAVPSASTLESLGGEVAYLWVTDDGKTLSENAYDSLPTYFDQLVSNINASSGCN